MANLQYRINGIILLEGVSFFGQSLSPHFASALELRFDVINVLDEVYKIRGGTSVSVGAPQFGPRRSFFAGARKEF